jgi:hypothetical protein
MQRIGLPIAQVVQQADMRIPEAQVVGHDVQPQEPPVVVERPVVNLQVQGPRGWLPDREPVPLQTTGEHTHVSMYDWRVPLPLAAPDPMEDLHTKMWTMFARFKQIDPSVTIYMYYREDREVNPGGISTLDQWNEWFGMRNLDTMRSFFNRAMLALQNEMCTMHVLIGSNQAPLQLSMSTNAFLGRLGYASYVKVLQIEDTRVIGWLAWSHFRTDKNALRAELERWTGFPVGLHWRVIWIRDRPLEPPVRALHIEVDESHWVDDMAVIRDIYNAARENNFPLHIRCRFVVDSNAATEDVGKMNRMRNLHANFGDRVRY